MKLHGEREVIIYKLKKNIEMKSKQTKTLKNEERKKKKKGRKDKEERKTSLQHLWFPDGPPSKY